MPQSFSFVVQSNSTLDAPSMKSVRSHVTREQMRKRRSLLEKQGAGKDVSNADSRDRRASQAKPRRKTKEKKKREGAEEDEKDEQSAEDIISPVSATFSESSDTSEIARRPSAQLSGTIAEFMTFPYDKSDMLEFFNRYYEFMGLYSVTNTTPEAEYSPFSGFLQQESFTNPAWLTSIALVAMQKLDIYRERESTHQMKFKAMALTALKKKVQDPEVDEPTILAIVALYAYEVLNFDGSPETERAVGSHYNGLLAYIKSKGGPERLAQTSPAYGVFLIRAMLSYEMIFALERNKDPQSVAVDIPRLRAFHHAADGTREPYFVGGPLLWPQSRTDQGSPDALEAIENSRVFTPECKNMLFDLFTTTEMLYMEYHSDLDANAKLQLSAIRLTMKLSEKPDLGTKVLERDEWTRCRVSRSCWLAGQMYHRAIVNLVPFTEPVNAATVTELHKLLKNIDIQAWSNIPYVHLWVALVGCAGSLTQVQRRFFAVQIGRCGILFGSRWWDNYRQAVVNFLWLQKVLRRELSPHGELLSPEPLLGSSKSVMNLDVQLSLDPGQYPLTPDSFRDTLSPEWFADPNLT